jgi:hypothetical protein
MFRVRFIILFLLLTINGLHAQYGTQENSTFRFNGYVKNMPSVQFSKTFDESHWNNLLHNRLNLAWQPNSSFAFVAEARNRFFAGETIRRYPILVDILEEDPGYVDLSKVWAAGDGWAMHTIVDRLYIDWKSDKWQVRAGRQRINWGINMVSNPNDLFNNYSFFDFDYEERPGSDAIRVQYFPSGMSRFEIAASPARETKQSVLAGLFAFNHKGYDIQALAGYYKNRLAVGSGWAGNLKTTGFKGEFTFFYDLEKIEGLKRANLVAAISFDHLFSSGIYGFAEFLYNGGYNRRPASVFDINQPLEADNIFLSEYAATVSLMYPFSPILSGSIATMYLPDAEAFFLSPSLSWSVMTNLDVQFVAQVFRGSSSSIFNQAGSAFYLALKWSF